jgi:Zn finger protein HypA/HybF involved in hydrogenase expression
MQGGKNILIPVSEEENMKYILFSLAVIYSVFLLGCKKPSTAKSNSLIATQKGDIRCKWCKTVQPLEKYRRINQTLASCPSCQKTIHIMEALYGKKKKSSR